MKHLFNTICLLFFLVVPGITAVAQSSIPAPIKTDTLGRNITPIARQKRWSAVVVNSDTTVFPSPPCMDGDFYIGFQLYYDLGDKNTTVNWAAHLDVTLKKAGASLWTKPLDIQMANQTFISTIFHDQAVVCNDSYSYVITAKTLTGATLAPNVYFKILLFKKHGNDFDPNTSFTSFNATSAGSQVLLGWNYIGDNATEFDIESLFIASYETALTGTVQDLFKKKAAASITTTGISYTHRIFYPDGKLYYRIRAVGYRDGAPGHRMLGQWSYASAPVTVTNQQSTIMWQAQTSYTEDGKYKKAINYYDATQRQRQSLMNLSTNDNSTFVGETLYDFEGRPSANMMTVPTDDITMTFKTDFNQFVAADSLITNRISSRRKKFHYDNGSRINSTTNSTSGAGRYYSTNNLYTTTPMRDYIPNANGYVYSQTEYQRDGKSMATRASSVGQEFKIDNANPLSNHTTRTYYGQASPSELIRLFGSNAGKASHYKKQLTVDSNGQGTVTYLDQEGRAIATALVGTPPANVESLPSFKALPMANVTVDISPKNKKELDRTITVHKILNEAPNTTYTINWSVSALAPDLGEFGCVGCTYDLSITLTAPDGRLVDISGDQNNPSDGITYQRLGIPAASCTVPNVVNDVSIGVSLIDVGDYTLTKVFTPRRLTVSAVKSLLVLDTDVQELISELEDAYVVDSLHCETCQQAVACPEAYKKIEDAIEEIANAECQSIYNQIIKDIKESHADGYLIQQSDIDGHALKCKWDRCKEDILSTVFEKQMARIPTYSAAASVNYFVGNSTLYNATLNMDPFFGAGGNGASSAGNMRGNLNNTIINTNLAYDLNGDGTTDGTRYVAGPIDEVIDPTNQTFFVDANGVQDARGYHVLYYGLMAAKSSMSTAEYNLKMDTAKWVMYRNFYMEAKRLTKISLSKYSSCNGTMSDLQEKINIPTSEEGIALWANGKGLIDTTSPEKIANVISFLSSKCGLTFSTDEKTSISNNLLAYFNSNKTNVLRLLLAEDIHINANLRAIRDLLGTKNCTLENIIAHNPIQCVKAETIPTGPNLINNPELVRRSGCSSINITNTCYSGWDRAAGAPRRLATGEIQLGAQACSAASDAVRGSFPALVPGQLYRMCFKYRAVSNIDNVKIQLSRTNAFQNASGAIEYGTTGNLNSAFVICPIYGALNPDPVERYRPPSDPPLFSDNLHSSIWEGGGSNTVYQDTCVYFRPTEASTFFYVSAGMYQGSGAAMLKDFNLQVVKEACVAYKIWNQDYNFKINWDTVRQRCINNAKSEKQYLVSYATDKLYEEQINKFYAKYNCLTNTTEQMSYVYKPREYHYTLYYFDQAGNLAQTVPPKGVMPLTPTQVQNFPSSGNPAHTQLSNYQLNAYNQVTSQSTPDAGTTNFWYNNKGQLRFSQNAQQAIAPAKYSYTKYDTLGRVIETGEFKPSVQPLNVSAVIETSKFPEVANGTLSDITWTYYDQRDMSLTGFTQFNLRNRVSYTETTDQQNAKGNINNLKTDYSYDIHGNVKAIRQYIPGLKPKKINYVYDLISNKVNYVFYQMDSTDQFVHRYTYDADNRLGTVYTSTDRFIWNKEVGYNYYVHGPLARTQYGEHNVQGQDYYYTLQGWLKGVNMPFAGDPGSDGIGGSIIGKDVTAYTLGYYQGDYSPLNTSTVQSDSRDLVWTQLNNQMGNTGLYNGNISWMITDLAKQGDLQSDRTKGMQAMVYKYDQLSRLKKSRSLTSYSTSGFASRVKTPLAYDEIFAYDPNGNMDTLRRYNQAGVLKDDYTYQYSPGTNKLSLLNIGTAVDLTISSGTVTSNTDIYRNIIVNGTAAFAASGNVELKALQSIQIAPTVSVPLNSQLWAHLITNGGMFQYDAVGNLVLDQYGATSVTWNPQGKVRQVKRIDNSSTTTFRYDPAGNRVEKKVVTSAGVTTITRYLRDATGNVMAVYNGTTMIEQPIYGSSRVGLYVGGAQEGKSILNLRRYELTNHLGNVLSVISDKVTMNGTTVTATALSTADYYPFGLTMAGRTWSDPTLNYRYGFNGKEKDADAEWGSTEYDYGFRIYNPTIGRFLSVDPLTKNYPMLTPYQFASNTPIQAIDVDGLEGVKYDVSYKDKGKTRIKTVVEVDVYVAVGANGYTTMDVPGIAQDLRKEYNGYDPSTGKSNLFKVKGKRVEFRFAIQTFNADEISPDEAASFLRQSSVVSTLSPNTSNNQPIRNENGDVQMKSSITAMVLAKKADLEVEGQTVVNRIFVGGMAVDPSHTRAHETGHFLLLGSDKNPNTPEKHDALGGIFKYRKIDQSGKDLGVSPMNRSNIKTILNNVPVKDDTPIRSPDYYKTERNR